MTATSRAHDPKPVARLSVGQVLAWRMRRQLLHPVGSLGVVDTVEAMVGAQAQVQSSAELGIALRRRNATVGEAAAAIADRTLMRTWAMRGTLHMVATRDVRWMVSLLGPVFAAKGRRRREQLGLDDATCERALTALASILAGSAQLTRAELVTRLAAEGIPIDPRTQQPPHLLGYAANRGLICRGPDRPGEEPAYVLLDDWAPDAPSLGRDEALAELARRYLGGFGPAAPADFAAWSGLPAPDGRRAWALIAGELSQVTASGERLSALAGGDEGPAQAGPAPRLLGHFDPYLLGYRDRGLVLDPRYTRRIQAGGGFIQPAVIVDGRVAGTWRLARDARRGTARITVEPFTALPEASRAGLAAEAADIGRFLGSEVTFGIAPAA